MLYVESADQRRAMEIQMEMCNVFHTLGIHNALIKQKPHELAALVEHTRKPIPNTDCDTRINTRMMIGLVSHHPSITNMNGRLLISTEGYYEIPDMHAPDFGSVVIRPGAMHPEWAEPGRISRLVDSGFGNFHLVDMGDGNLELARQVMVLFGDEVPLFGNVLYRRMPPQARRDFVMLNQLLSSLKNECRAGKAAA